MRPISATELASIFGAAQRGEAGAVTGFATDSRGVKQGDLFLAIKGERVDGHDCVSAALERGAVASLVERPVAEPYLEVESIVSALARYGGHYRDHFNGPVIGITGSAGKTTTKEFVSAALSPLGKVLKSEGNRNTEYTSPLVWSDLESDTKAVVVEMAMRGFGQIAHLASISKPTIGIVTNIGYAHLMQTGTREGIARAKGELIEALPSDGQVVIWNECPHSGLLRDLAASRPVKTFGFREESDCRIVEYKPLDWSSARISGTLGGASWEAKLPAAGRHIALDAAAAILAAACAGVAPEQAAVQLQHAKLPPMRMEVREISGAVVLLDNYNASPPSMISAIETLADLPVEGRRFAVIGEMRELGEQTEEAHRLVGQSLRENRLDRILFVGPATRFTKEELGNGGADVSMTDSLSDVTDFLQELRPGDAALIKGSRALELEKALESLC